MEELTKVTFGLFAGLMAGFFEELGWTGFALPRLMARFNFLASGIILGVLWAIWHLMADFWGNNATFGLYWLPTFIVFWLMPLTAYRVLMVWVYKNNPSLPLMQIMHAFYSGTLGILGPAMPAADGLVWKALFASLLWIFLTIVLIRFGREKTAAAQPLPEF